MVIETLDVDYSLVHKATGGDGKQSAPDSWWEAEKAKLAALRKEHPGFYAYRTRGGYRIVWLLSDRFVILDGRTSALWTVQYLQLCAYLIRFGIIADPLCSDWQHLFRAPHATRDNNPSPERLESLGDAHNILPISYQYNESIDGYAAKLEAERLLPDGKKPPWDRKIQWLDLPDDNLVPTKHKPRAPGIVGKKQVSRRRAITIDGEKVRIIDITTSKQACKALKEAGVGSRNQTHFDMRLRLASIGVELDTITAVAREVGLDDGEIERTAKSVADRVESDKRYTESEGIIAIRRDLHNHKASNTVTLPQYHHAVVKRILAWNMLTCLVIKGPCGSGKTKAIIDVMKQKHPWRFLVLSISHLLAKQTMADAFFSGETAEHREGQLHATDENGKPLCDNHAKRTAWQTLGGVDSLDIKCGCAGGGKCKGAGNDHGCQMISSVHQMAIGLYEQRQQDGLYAVFDECPALFELKHVTTESLEALLKADTNETTGLLRSITTMLYPWIVVMGNALKQTEGELIGRLRSCANDYYKYDNTMRFVQQAEQYACSAYNRNTGQFSTSQGAEKVFLERFKQHGSDPLARIRAAASGALDRMVSWLQKPDTILTGDDDEVKKIADYIGAARSMAHAASAPLLEQTEIGIQFIQPTALGLFIQTHPVILLDAAPPMRELRMLCPDLELLDLNVPDRVKGTLREIVHSRYGTKKSLVAEDVPQWEIIEKLLREDMDAALKHGVQRLLVGTFQTVERPINESTAPSYILDMVSEYRRKFKELHFGHYGAFRGLNSWRHFDGFLSLGDPRRYLPFVEALARYFKYKGIEADDKQMNKEYASEELAQFHGRGRGPVRDAPAWHRHRGACVPDGWSSDSGARRVDPSHGGRPRKEAAMNKDEFVAIGKKLGWTVRAAALALGVSKSLVGYFRTGEQSIPMDVATQVRAFLKAYP